MCGIAGIVNLDEGLAPATLEQMERMIGAIRYRGPDDFGVFREVRRRSVTRGCQSSTSPPASSP